MFLCFSVYFSPSQKNSRTSTRKIKEASHRGGRLEAPSRKSPDNKRTLPTKLNLDERTTNRMNERTVKRTGGVFLSKLDKTLWEHSTECLSHWYCVARSSISSSSDVWDHRCVIRVAGVFSVRGSAFETEIQGKVLCRISTKHTRVHHCKGAKCQCWHVVDC